MDRFWDFLETLLLVILVMSPFILLGFIAYMCLR